MTRSVPVKRKRGPRRGAVLDPKYRDWIRSLPCLICWANCYLGSVWELVQVGWSPDIGTVQESVTECAHVGDRGLGQKCSDYETVPLCAIEHHRLGPESHHKLGKAFWSRHGLNRDEVLKQLREGYQAENGLPLAASEQSERAGKEKS